MLYLVDEISRHQSIRTAAWVLLANFSQSYSEKKEQKPARWEDLENLQPGQRRRSEKVCAGQKSVKEKLPAKKRWPYANLQNNENRALRAS